MNRITLAVILLGISRRDNSAMFRPKIISWGGSFIANALSVLFMTIVDSFDAGVVFGDAFDTFLVNLKDGHVVSDF